MDSSSNVAWEGTKLFGMGGHNGTFGISEGSLSIEDGTITAGNFTINMTCYLSVGTRTYRARTQSREDMRMLLGEAERALA